jgi:hypothetical protein
MPDKLTSPAEVEFHGWRTPRYTQIPDELFDRWLHVLTGAELKVLLYIMRRTFGFKKDDDDISISQLSKGIVKRDGTRLDYGTGLNKSTVVTAIQSLEARGMIVAERRSSQEKGLLATNYCLRMDEADAPYTDNPYRGIRKNRIPLYGKAGTQETVEQDTELQETDSSNIRWASAPDNSPTRTSKLARSVYDDARRLIADYVDDIARELGDSAPMKSSVSRADRLYRAGGLSLDEFCEQMLAARTIVKEKWSSIKGSGETPSGRRARMSYWFAVIEDSIRLRAPDET